MAKILLTDKIVADARDRGLTIKDAIETAYEGEIADMRKSNAKLEKLNGLELAMFSAGLSKHSPIKAFYTTQENDLLFPAIIDTRLAETVSASPMLSLLIGSQQFIDGVSVKALKLDLTSDANKKALKKRDVVEGADLPVVKIATGDKAISLYKRGVAVEATYESIRHTTLDMFIKTLDVIAANTANQQIGDAIDVLVNGDGNNNAANATSTLAGSTLAAGDLINFCIDFYDATGGLTVDTLVVAKTVYAELCQLLVEINKQNTYRLGANFNFPQTMFQNMNVIYDSRVPQNSSSKNIIIGLNRANALTKYTESGSIINEIDRNIRNQTKIGTLSETVGFAKFVDNASRILTLK